MQRLLCLGKADILAFYLELRQNNYITWRDNKHYCGNLTPIVPK